ncbi:MAG: hypothetical protein KDD15_13335, partial [Lewinella sp.]|nr:hypothetical protein [Lewinella sp.]
LVKIHDILYLRLKVNPNTLPDNPSEGVHYEYINVPVFNDLTDLAKISHFDLIYYIAKIEELIPLETLALDHIRQDLTSAVLDFFSGHSYRSSISNATTCAEFVWLNLKAYLQKDVGAIEFAKLVGFDWGKVRDSIGGIAHFFKKFSEAGKYHENFSPLISVY